MKTHLSLHQKCIIIVALPVLLAIIFTACLAHLLQEAESDLKREAFAADVMARATELHRLFFDAGYAIFLFHTTRSERYGAEFDQTEKQIDNAQGELYKLLLHDDTERSLAKRSRNDSTTGLELMHKIRHGAPPEFGGTIDLRTFQRDGQKMNKKLLDDYMQIYDYAKQIRDRTPAYSAQSRSNVVNFLIALVGVNVVLALGLATYFTRAITMRLQILNDNANRIARGDSLNPSLKGEDEIAALDQSFRTMAAHVSEASRKERALTDNASDVLCSIDKSLKFVKVSPASAKVWSYEPDELIETRLRNLLSEDTAENTTNKLRELISNQGETVFDSRLIRKDGKTIDARWAAYWSESEQAIFCVCHDITHEKELERLKQQLMDTVAHDLRAPLTSIKAILGLLATGVLGDLSERARDRVHTAENETERLVRLVNDLLDFDRLEAGRTNFAMSKIDFQDAVSSSVNAVDQLAQEKQVRIVSGKSESIVEGDADRLVQVLVNLLSNAIKFSPPGGTVEIRVQAEDAFLKVSVIDQGGGIPETSQSEIFERFKQIDSSPENRAVKGSGLGLPIASQIVKGHGGKIGVESSPGQGSTFWFTIPISHKDSLEHSSKA